MKNTGITYTSAERSPVILPEMAELLPPLSAEQLDALEADLIKNGCYSPIIVNEDMVIIDGHNRQSLCEKHGLPYTMAVFSFEDLLEAKQWALDTQKGRRNLEKWELGKIALKLKPEIEAKAKANMAAGGQNFRPSEAEEGSATLPNLPSVEKAVDTRKELAEAVGLGERTMGKVMQIDENAPEVIKEALDKKELSINKGYDLTRQLQDVPEDQREQAAAELLEYEKAKKDLKQQNAEIDRRGKVANTFCKAYEKASLLTATEENVRCWTEGTRMTLEELQDTVKESREIAQVFMSIADIIEQTILPSDWRNTDPTDDTPGGGMRKMLSVRQWQDLFRSGAFQDRSRETQIRAGWYDWFCADSALAGRLQRIGRVVMGITEPAILDNYYVWFKNNCPLDGPLYDDVRFEPLEGDRCGRYFVVSQDCPYEKQKWTLYTERGGFQEPEFGCQSVREMQGYLNEHGKELARETEPPTVTKMPKNEAPTR